MKYDYVQDCALDVFNAGCGAPWSTTSAIATKLAQSNTGDRENDADLKCLISKYEAAPGDKKKVFKDQCCRRAMELSRRILHFASCILHFALFCSHWSS